MLLTHTEPYDTYAAMILGSVWCCTTHRIPLQSSIRLYFPAFLVSFPSTISACFWLFPFHFFLICHYHSFISEWSWRKPSRVVSVMLQINKAKNDSAKRGYCLPPQTGNPVGKVSWWADADDCFVQRIQVLSEALLSCQCLVVLQEALPKVELRICLDVSYLCAPCLFVLEHLSRISPTHTHTRTYIDFLFPVLQSCAEVRWYLLSVLLWHSLESTRPQNMA